MAALPTDEQRELYVQYAEALEEDAEDSDQRCDDLVEAGGYWHMAGDHEREERALAAAAEVDDGGNVLSGHASYATFLLTHGRYEEGEQLLAQLLRRGSDCEWAYAEAAAGYEAIGSPQEALRWLNVGVTRFVPDLDAELEHGDPGFAVLRQRAVLRRELGMPADQYDELHAHLQERAHQIFEQIEEISHRHDPTAVLYWPEAEFAEVQRRHPDWHPNCTHLQHRQEVQRTLAEQPNSLLATGSLDALVAFAESRELPLEELSTRAEFVAEAVQTTSWPPGRNEPCWCGSERKYKKCCGALASPDAVLANERGSQ